jgi:hypothetical protein
MVLADSVQYSAKDVCCNTVARLSVWQGLHNRDLIHLLAPVHKVRVVHQSGSVALAAKSCHSNVVHSSVHIVHHFGERIHFVVVYILFHVSEVGAANTDIII